MSNHVVLPAVIALALGLGLWGTTHALEEKSQGTLRYVSGGVGDDEIAAISLSATQLWPTTVVEPAEC